MSEPPLFLIAEIAESTQVERGGASSSDRLLARFIPVGGWPVLRKSGFREKVDIAQRSAEMDREFSVATGHMLMGVGA